MAKHRIFITRHFPEPILERAKAEFDCTLSPDGKGMSMDDIVAIAGDYDGFLCAGGDDFSAGTIMALPDTIKCISSVSVGYEHIDISACRTRGIRVGNTPGVLDEATADTAWLCLMGAARKAQNVEALLRSGKWGQFEPDFSTDIHRGKRLGILGMGGIGRIVAKRSQGWDMEVHYHNRNRLSADLENGAIYHDSIESLFKVSDILSLNCPLTPETTGVVNAQTIEYLPKDAIVVNTARGPVVDDDALIAALQSGRIYAAGLDVFTGEPNFDKRYLELDNVFLLPHVGTATLETRTAMGYMAIDNAIAAFNNDDMPSERT